MCIRSQSPERQTVRENEMLSYSDFPKSTFYHQEPRKVNGMDNIIKGIDAILTDENLWSDGKRLLQKVKEQVEQQQADIDRMAKQIDEQNKGIERQQKVIRDLNAVAKGFIRMAEQQGLSENMPLIRAAIAEAEEMLSKKPEALKEP